MSLVDALNQAWNQVLDVMTIFVTPDWGFLISMLPVLVVIGLVGPFLTFVMLGSVIYLVRKPRVMVSYEEGPRIAEIGADGAPVYPVGYPHCRRDQLVFPSGTVRCDRCRDELAVVCPMCGLGRSAMEDTCSNCGLVLRVKARSVVARTPVGPRPGGAAAA